MGNGHQLFTSQDFKHMSGQEQEDNWTARMVLDGGLSICKVCGEGESGLEKPCKPKRSIQKSIPLN